MNSQSPHRSLNRRERGLRSSDGVPCTSQLHSSRASWLAQGDGCTQSGYACVVGRTNGEIYFERHEGLTGLPDAPARGTTTFCILIFRPAVGAGHLAQHPASPSVTPQCVALA
jgi:hypothetical protein